MFWEDISLHGKQECRADVRATGTNAACGSTTWQARSAPHGAPVSWQILADSTVISSLVTAWYAMLPPGRARFSSTYTATASSMPGPSVQVRRPSVRLRYAFLRTASYRPCAGYLQALT